MKEILDYKTKDVGNSERKNNVTLSCVIENDNFVSFSVYYCDFEVCVYTISAFHTVGYCYRQASKDFIAF
jgi:hypothetical protein